MMLWIKIALAVIVAIIFLKLIKKIVHAVVIGAIAYCIFQYFT